MNDTLLDWLLARFPVHTHALTLASDPDFVLADEEVAGALHERGFRLIREPDPVALRCAILQAQPITVERPVIVATAGRVNTLPFDLWQQGQHVELALYRLFPNLDYPTLRLLTPQQRRRLAAASARAPLTEPLSVKQTRSYLLTHACACDLAALGQPGLLLRWLADWHVGGEQLPAPLLETAVEELQRLPAFTGWPLAELFADAERFREFVQSSWQGYVQAVREGAVAYTPGALAFDRDASLQDALPRLVRSGALNPVQVNETANLPNWVYAAVSFDPQLAREREILAAIEAIESQLRESTTRWADWTAIARHWARLTTWRYDLDFPLVEHTREHLAGVQSLVDQAFSPWLQQMYGVLAGQRLPEPHHLFHVPAYLASRRSAHPRVALVILDGMSLAAWQQIRAVWQARHPAWTLDERLVLAQAPSVTSISRQALVSGSPPRRFAAHLATNEREPAEWRQFWMSRSLAERSIAYANLPNGPERALPAAVDSAYTQALCLILRDVDDIVHGATQGVADVHASLQVWLHGEAADRGSRWVEQLIQTLLDHHYLVTLTSDHGHVEAVGMGQPQEGVLVESRALRARIYERAHFADTVRRQFLHTVVWHDDGLLPPERWVLMPAGREAFAPAGQVVVSHGGLSVEEMIVPLVTIT